MIKLYIVPTVIHPGPGPLTGGRVPKYFVGSGTTWTVKYYGFEPVCLVVVDATQVLDDQLQTYPDVIAVPDDLDTQIGSKARK